MFSFDEYRFQSCLLDKHGTIEINTEYVTRKKPAWLVLLKLLGVAAMVAVGYAIVLPTLQAHLPHWQAIAAIAGVMLLYTGLAFFFRPEPNTDNLGWFGGGMNDPTQYSDNINRNLWSLHMALGPGRFSAETLLDFCVLVGLAHGDEIIDDSSAEMAAAGTADHSDGRSTNSVSPPDPQPRATVPAGEPPPSLSPARFEVPSSAPGMQLDSWKYFQQ